MDPYLSHPLPLLSLAALLCNTPSPANPLSKPSRPRRNSVTPLPRRCVIAIFLVPFSLSPTVLVGPSEARERCNRRTIPTKDYLITPSGFKYYDLVEGKGLMVEKVSTVQPYEFKVGDPPGKEWKREFVDNPNGLFFFAQVAPKPLRKYGNSGQTYKINLPKSIPSNNFEIRSA
ncbi:hypothetical protein UlMin_030122 [Ulmus minor]